MQEFRYSLIRYIPDVMRMEPTNVGIILQGKSRLDFQLSRHAAKRSSIDTDVFQSWRKFFEEEIRGEAMPLLQPSKFSTKFFDHLSLLCRDTVRLSPALILKVNSDESFDHVLGRLFDQLVSTGSKEKEVADRASSVYREFEVEKKFLKRGLQKHPYIPLTDARRWNAFRSAKFSDGSTMVIDKVEINNQVGLAADEIQKLSSGVQQFLEKYFGQAQGKDRSYHLIADPLVEKFGDQSDENFSIMLEEYEKIKEVVTQSGGVVLRDKDATTTLAKTLDLSLPQADFAISS